MLLNSRYIQKLRKDISSLCEFAVFMETDMRKVLDMVGRKIGLLTVIKLDPIIYPDGHARWECICECGTITGVKSDSLRNGNTRSCGCLPRGATEKHGLRKSPEYKAWSNIKQRCYNPKDRCYRHYGGRGITVCDEWKESFETFYKDMGPRPSDEHSIERKDNDKGYSKDNCRWATKLDQANNTRRNIFYFHNGVAKTIPNWCRELNLDPGLIYHRVYVLGWSFEDAITKPIQ